MGAAIIRSKAGKKPCRLTNIQTQFVSLVQRGANRQSKFFVVKADGAASEDSAGAPPAGSMTGGPGDAERAPVADLDAWLAKAGTRAEELLVDAVLDATLAAPTPPAPAQGSAVDKAQIGDTRSAPSDQAPGAGEDDLGKVQREAEALREQLQKAEEARKRAEDAKRQAERRTERLMKAAVGGTTALVSGTVDLAAAQAAAPEISEKSRAAWKAGGDLAR